MGLAAAATVPAPALATAIGGLPASQAPDPILAVVAEHQAALKASIAANCARGCLIDHTPEWKVAQAVAAPASEREADAHEAVFATDPTTLAGVAALLEHVAQDEFLGDEDEDRDDRQTLLSAMNECLDPWKRRGQDFPLRVAAALRAMAGTAIVRRIEPSERDPIYAAIERHRAAWKDLGERCGDFADDEAPEAQAALAALHDEVGAAVDDLNNTEPTTIAGAVALLRYAASNQEMADMIGVELHDPGVLAGALEKIEAQS